MRVAGEVGAGRLVQGEIVGTGRRLTVSARILDVPAGTISARASAEGSADSLPQLVDRLAANLLALGAGEEEQRLDALTSTSLPALRAYLDGEALLRRGAFRDAERKFVDALALDTTFALAGMGAARANEWYSGDETGALAAWRHRERLSRRDLARLETILGPRHPAPSSMGDRIKAAERFVALAPDSPDAWYKLGDYVFHYGPLARAHGYLPARRGRVRPLALARLDLRAHDRAPARDRGGAGRFRRCSARAGPAAAIRLGIAQRRGATVAGGGVPGRHGRDAVRARERQHPGRKAPSTSCSMLSTYRSISVGPRRSTRARSPAVPPRKSAARCGGNLEPLRADARAAQPSAPALRLVRSRLRLTYAVLDGLFADC